MAEFTAVTGSRARQVLQVLALVLCTALSGCLGDQRRSVSDCSLHAQSNLQIEACMELAGYEQVFRSGHCRHQLAPARDALCYRPRTAPGRIAFMAELISERLTAGLKQWL